MVPCPSHHTSLTVKCAAATTNNASMTPVCDEVCGRPRTCGNYDHTCDVCEAKCHRWNQLIFLALVPFWRVRTLCRN
jgi:transcriptional repressor NF-X1